MSAHIIQLSRVRDRAEVAARAPAAKEATKPETERQRRWKSWCAAEADTDFWHAKLNYMRAVRRARRENVASVLLFNPPEWDEMELVRQHSAALARQLATPAYNMAALLWKKRQIDRGYIQHHVSVATMEVIKKQIAEDEAWLEAHKRRPSRQEES